MNVGADLIVALLTAAVPYRLAGELLLVGALAAPPDQRTGSPHKD
jgi:hypothetical protein